MKRRYGLALIIVFLLFFILIRFVGKLGHETGQTGNVVRVIDGDTVELRDHGRVRLLGIDTPEENELYYDSASIFLANLVKNKAVGVKPGTRARDHYGRLLAYLYIDDTILVNEKIIAGGYGYVYLFDNDISRSPEVSRLLAAQNNAIDANRGIWKLPHREEDYYVGNRRSLRLHRPDCASLTRMKTDSRVIFESREEAFRLGYSPCRNCKP